MSANRLTRHGIKAWTEIETEKRKFMFINALLESVTGKMRVCGPAGTREVTNRAVCLILDFNVWIRV